MVQVKLIGTEKEIEDSIDILVDADGCLFNATKCVKYGYKCKNCLTSEIETTIKEGC